MFDATTCQTAARIARTGDSSSHPTFVADIHARAHAPNVNRWITRRLELAASEPIAA